MIGRTAPPSWDLTHSEAIARQTEIARAIERADRLGDVSTIAGVDVAYSQRGRVAVARGAAVLFDAATGDVLDQATVDVPVTFPYVPGLLSFREAPPAIAALEALRRRPDLLMCDGQGIAHPRRCGFASHLGYMLDLPSIGVAKSRLIGAHEPPGPDRGSWTALRDRDECIGVCLRTRSHVRPVYVSIGHRVSLPTALHIVLEMTTRYRLPEPIRLADRLSRSTV
jgi:deoxyribonuclease V